MLHDVVVSPFGASAQDMVEVARCAEDGGFDGVWTYDHMTGTMLDRGRSHDAFAVLGAMAAATASVRLGPLVANMMNRHPVQLAVAMATLQSLSDGRAVLGIGAGAAPGSRFAREHEAIGTAPLDGGARRRRLVETIAVVRRLWAGQSEFRGEFFRIGGLDFGLDEPSAPPIIVGAGSRPTVELAVRHADGVNLRVDRRLPELLAAIGRTTDADFETSIHVPIDLDHRTGGALPAGATDGVARRVLAVSAPFDLARLIRLGSQLASSAQ